MELDRTAFHEDRLKCLDAESVERRSSVEEDRMVLDDNFECIPDFVSHTLDHLAGALDVAGCLRLDKSLHYERLEEFESHFLRQTALIHLEFRSDDDNRTS